MLRACVISNDSEKLARCLDAYLKQTNRFVVIDTEKNHSENSATIARLRLDALHASETALSSSPFPLLFSGGYGGFRNLALLLCAKDGSHAAFFDDDTSPANDCVARYESLFSEGKKVVCGKYLKQAGGTTNILLEVMSVLRECQKGAGEEQCRNRLSSLFSGIPKETSEIITGAGLVGGNLGVSLESLRRYCFLPSPYRIEDGLFGVLAPRFLGVDAVYNPAEKTEARTRLPAVFHEKTPVKNALVKNLKNEIAGVAIAHCVAAKLDGKPIGVQAAASLAFEEYLLPYIAQKNAQHDFTKTASELGFAEDFNNLLSITPEKIMPAEDEAVSLASSFIAAQNSWSAALEWASRQPLNTLLG